MDKKIENPFKSGLRKSPNKLCFRFAKLTTLFEVKEIVPNNAYGPGQPCLPGIMGNDFLGFSFPYLWGPTTFP